MINRILQLATDDLNGNPVVPGAYQVVPQRDGIYSAQLAQAPNTGGNTRWTHPHYAVLQEVKPGLYAVFATKADLQKIDPTNNGELFDEWQKTPANLAKWPYYETDEDGNPTAVPTMPSDMADFDLVVTLKKTAQAIEL